jgi:hypothetical protein
LCGLRRQGSDQFVAPEVGLRALNGEATRVTIRSRLTRRCSRRAARSHEADSECRNAPLAAERPDVSPTSVEIRVARGTEKARRTELHRELGLRKPKPVPNIAHRPSPAYLVTHACFACRTSRKLAPTPDRSPRRCSTCGGPAIGWALVYASYGCGNLCGYSWLFVLKKSDDKWQVQSSVVTSIS